MELSRITLYPAAEGAEGLYYKGGALADGVLNMREGDSADFATFYSALDAQLLLERTTVRNVTLRLFFDGKVKVTLTRYIASEEKPRNMKKKYSSYTVGELVAENGCKLDVDTYGGGLLAFRVTALGKAVFYGGVWECPDECALRRIRLGIAVCTYKREDDIRRNAVTYSGLCREIEDLDVYVIDNGGTLTPADLADGVTLIPSRNLGGSGGFSRGMIECTERSKTHFLLMDDDVLFDANAVRRTVALLSVLKEEYANYSLGGAMMTFGQPDVVYENGAFSGGVKIKFPKRNVPVTDVGGLLWCAAKAKVNYTGWWYFCAPVSVLKTTGLSLPLFIKYDDAEFGMRIQKLSPTLNTIGIGVWHNAFENKLTPYLGYYWRRNGLVMHAVSGKRAGLKIQAKVMGSYFRYALTNRRLLDYIYDGVDDYLKGPEYLMSVSGDKLNEQVMASPRKKRNFFTATFKAAGLFFRLLGAGSLNKKYLRYRDDLTSATNWKIRLGMEVGE